VKLSPIPTAPPTAVPPRRRPPVLRCPTTRGPIADEQAHPAGPRRRRIDVWTRRPAATHTRCPAMPAPSSHLAPSTATTGHSAAPAPTTPSRLLGNRSIAGTMPKSEGHTASVPAPGRLFPRTDGASAVHRQDQISSGNRPTGIACIRFRARTPASRLAFPSPDAGCRLRPPMMSSTSGMWTVELVSSRHWKAHPPLEMPRRPTGPNGQSLAPFPSTARQPSCFRGRVY